MKVLRCDQVREMDQKSIQLGISGMLLMEHAAMALAKAVKKAALQYGKNIAVVCGKGNNGGDGYALARLLLQDKSLSVTIIANHQPADLQGDAKANAQIAHQLQIPIVPFERFDAHQYDIIVDCLFGSGLCKAIHAPYTDVIERINQSNAYVIACDIPSGITADQGLIAGCAVKAQETITFAAGKLGLYMNEGITHCGNITIADIHIPNAIMDQYDGCTILEDAVIQKHLPIRTARSHKRTYGNLLLIGGRKGMSGALLMATKAALRCGAGLCTMMGDETTAYGAHEVTEAMTLPFPDQTDDVDFQQLLAQYDRVAIGNGLGRDERAMWLVQQVWKSDCLAVFDGDALFLLGEWKNRPTRKNEYVLTPHPKELFYLLGIETRKLLENPSEALIQSERAFPNGVIAMKNTRTLISDGKKRYLNVNGNHGLATGGSGDVLCGMILGFWGQMQKGMDAAICAVYLHGKCADTLAEHMAAQSLLPRDLIKQIPQELKTLLETMTD